MAELMIEVQTGSAAMSEVKPRLDEALAAQFPGGMLQRRWEGDVDWVGPGHASSRRNDRAAPVRPPA